MLCVYVFISHLIIVSIFILHLNLIRQYFFNCINFCIMFESNKKGFTEFQMLINKEIYIILHVAMFDLNFSLESLEL